MLVGPHWWPECLGGRYRWNHLSKTWGSCDIPSWPSIGPTNNILGHLSSRLFLQHHLDFTLNTILLNLFLPAFFITRLGRFLALIHICLTFLYIYILLPCTRSAIQRRPAADARVLPMSRQRHFCFLSIPESTAQCTSQIGGSKFLNCNCLSMFTFSGSRVEVYFSFLSIVLDELAMSL